MPRQSEDRKSTWVLDEANQTWTLDDGVRINLRQTIYEIGIDDRSFGTSIKVLGSIATFETGVKLGSASSSLTIGKNGWVAADFGVAMYPGAHVANHGLITGDNIGINGFGGTISNTGTIQGGDTGVNITDGAFTLDNAGMILSTATAVFANRADGTITIDKGAEITGVFGIELRMAAVEIVNDGVLRGIDYALTALNNSVVDIVNRGKIVGDILLGEGENRIDTRDGIIHGKISGGFGDDTYLIARSGQIIDDQGSTEGDLVKSTASYTLAGGLDDLVLLGKHDIDGTGNAGHNELTGNAGDNKLRGGSGDDIFSGGAGDDRLWGEGDEDLFIFNRGFDRDRIVDFANGVDHISSDYVQTQRQFDRLDTRQAGEHLILTFADGDRLTLDNFSEADLDFSDFLIT